MYDKPEFPPLLQEGFRAVSLTELEELCVTRFPLSRTRSKIFEGFRHVIDRIAACGMSYDLWLNGSFLTEKIDPADVDLVAWIPSHFYDDGTAQQRGAIIDWLTSPDNEPRTQHHCDTHAEPIYPADSPFHYMVAGAIEHWQSIYGKAVESGESKGIAIVSLKETA